MKRFFFLLLLSSISSLLLGQSDSLHFVYTKGQYASYEPFLPVRALDSCNQCLRIQLENTFIDIFQEEDGNFKIQRIEYIHQLELVEIEKKTFSYQFKGIIHSKLIEDCSNCKDVIVAIQSSGLDTIGENLLYDWGLFCSCEGWLSIQKQSNQKIMKSTYRSLQCQPDTLDFVEEAKSLYQFLYNQFNIKENYTEFKNKLPRGYAYIEGGTSYYIWD